MKNQTIITILLILGILISFGIPIASADVTDGLTAYYPFDGNASDQSGNDNHGTEYGDLKYKSGIRGDSASLDGIDDFIRVPSSPSLNPADQLSISFWMKVEGITNLWSPIIHKGGPRLSGYKNREYSVWLRNDTSIYLASAGNGLSQIDNFTCCAKVGSWTHYVGVIDRQNHKIKGFLAVLYG